MDRKGRKKKNVRGERSQFKNNNNNKKNTTKQWVSLIAQLVNNPPAMLETLVRSLGREGKGIVYPLQYSWASLVAQLIKNPPAMLET